MPNIFGGGGMITQFLSSFAITDIAKPSYFDVTINVPTAINTPGSARQLNVRCESAELPSRTLITYDLKTYGPTEKFPYQNSYNDVTMTFIVQDDMYEKQFFDNWLNFISSTNDFNFKYKTDYCTDIQIIQYDQTGVETYGVNLRDAYPIAVNQLDLSWSADGYHKVTVVFAYTYWENITGLTNAGAPDDIADEINSSTDAIGVSSNVPLFQPPFPYSDVS
jgi:hypothetical protein